MVKIRLYVEEALSQDISLTLNPQQSHYTYNVMRLKRHDNLFLFNGKDGKWLGEITNIICKAVKVTLKKCVEEQQHGKSLHLYCAIVKNAALNNIIRQATEMGVTSIQFILTKRTVIRSVNLERAKLQVIEAAEQCERMDIPKILPPIYFHDLSKSQDKNFILCDRTGKTLDKLSKGKKETAVIVGPEGGFSTDELDFADSFCQKLSLGKRILRVDTAVVTSLACVLFSSQY